MAIFIVTNAVDKQKEHNSQSLKAIEELTSELVVRAEVAFSN